MYYLSYLNLYIYYYESAQNDFILLFTFQISVILVLR